MNSNINTLKIFHEELYQIKTQKELDEFLDNSPQNIKELYAVYEDQARLHGELTLSIGAMASVSVVLVPGVLPRHVQPVSGWIFPSVVVALGLLASFALAFLDIRVFRVRRAEIAEMIYAEYQVSDSP